MTTVLTRVLPVVEPAAAAWALLDAAEDERARRRADPWPFVTAHAALRRLVGEHLDCPPAAIVLHRRCPSCGSSRHGKPILPEHPDIHLSLSYGDAVVVVALGEGAPVGVDVEDVRATDFAGFDRVTLAPEERAALAGMRGAELLRARATVWARKEAILKATGHGLVVDPVQVVVSDPSARPRLLTWSAPQERPAQLSMADLDLIDPDHVGALAVLGPGPVRVRQV